jgi:BirA family biotin operon repressor/biotin-[acetyl-CoA-carboxylase] ligase
VPDSPYADLDRPPLNERALGRALVRDGGLWREIKVIAETGSTNADLAAAARAGAPEGTVLVAELQTAGKGRLGRAWQAPPRSGLTFSLLLRPQVPLTRLTWMPLLTGVAVAVAVERMTSRAVEFQPAGDFGTAVGSNVVRTALKWPNDVLVGERKLAGILAERAGEAMIVGIGLNVSLRQAELPTPAATSLTIENAAFTDRGPLLRAILREFERWYGDWLAADGDPDQSGLRAAYRSACATLGQDVRVELPGSADLRGAAYDIDTEGRLLVRADGGGIRAVGAGDVVHVRGGE